MTLLLIHRRGQTISGRSSLAAAPGLLQVARSVRSARSAVRASLLFSMSAFLAFTAMPAHAGQPVAGAIIGGGAGALIGQAIGGRDGAIAGAAIGAAAGAASASRMGGRHGASVQVGAGYAAPIGVGTVYAGTAYAPGYGRTYGPAYGSAYGPAYGPVYGPVLAPPPPLYVAPVIVPPPVYYRPPVMYAPPVVPIVVPRPPVIVHRAPAYRPGHAHGTHRVGNRASYDGSGWRGQPGYGHSGHRR